MNVLAIYMDYVILVINPTLIPAWTHINKCFFTWLWCYNKRHQNHWGPWISTVDECSCCSPNSSYWETLMLHIRPTSPSWSKISNGRLFPPNCQKIPVTLREQLIILTKTKWHYLWHSDLFGEILDELWWFHVLWKLVFMFQEGLFRGQQTNLSLLFLAASMDDRHTQTQPNVSEPVF